MYVCHPFPRLGGPCYFSSKWNQFFRLYPQDETSTMPGIYLKCPKNIFDKFKNLFEKVWFSAEIRRSTFVNPCHVWGVFANSPLNKIYFPFSYLQDEASTMPGIYLKCTKHIFDKLKNLFEKVRFSAEIRRSTFVTQWYARHLFEMSKTYFWQIETPVYKSPILGGNPKMYVCNPLPCLRGLC